MELPPYAYVPGGRWPHPTRSPQGHAYGAPEPEETAFDPQRWPASTAYRQGFTLFDAGYYWEAHEAWESLWKHLDRSDPAGQLLGGLIKLAAAGVKMRQGLPAKAVQLAERAAEHFERAVPAQRPTLAGVSRADVLALCRHVASTAPALTTSREAVVERVFSLRLEPMVSSQG